MPFSTLFHFMFFRHFLFKTSSGTTPLFSSSSPGYPLTSGTVYTPPPRLLPRNTFSRNAFKLKKPSKYCSWKCAALSAIAAAVLLAILLAYFIGKAMFSLSNHMAVSENESSADKRMVNVFHKCVFLVSKEYYYSLYWLMRKNKMFKSRSLS